MEEAETPEELLAKQHRKDKKDLQGMKIDKMPGSVLVNVKQLNCMYIIKTINPLFVRIAAGPQCVGSGKER